MYKDRILFLVFLLLMTVSFGQNKQQNTVVINTRIDSLCRTAGTAIQNFDYEQSLKNFESARELATSIDNKNRIGLTSNYLAQVYLQLGDYKKANIECIQAITIQQGINDIPGLGNSFLTSAQIQLKLSNYEKAGQYLEQASKIFKDLKDEFHLASTYLYKGNREFMLKNLEEAITNYDSALSIFNKTDKDEYLKSKTALQKAKVHAALDQYEMALVAGNMAYDISVKNNYPQIE
ncbi:MAG: tetratricopeptide repeat protein, partial [Leeuwenhoekiella sp.]